MSGCTGGTGARPARHSPDGCQVADAPDRFCKHLTLKRAPNPFCGSVIRAQSQFQDIKSNQQGCVRLAQRAIELLMFLQKRTEGKEDAPQSLLDDIREFEE
jgi:hypothetical protein